MSYCNAAYPALHVTTFEDARLIKELKYNFTPGAPSYSGMDKLVYEWNCLSGLTCSDPRAKQKSIPTAADPLKMFDSIKELMKSQANLLFVITDFHNIWKAPLKSALLIASFKQLLPLMKANTAMCLFVSSSNYIPQELIKDIQTIEYSLPDEAAIRSKLEYILASLNKTAAAEKQQPWTISTEIADAAVAAARGLTSSEVESAFSLAIVEAKQFNAQFVKSVFTEKIQQVRKSGFLNHLDSNVTFAQVGGLEYIKAWIATRKGSYSKAARDYRLPFLKGIGLAGVQGCGKTLISKAISNELNFPLFQLDLSKLFDKHVGETEQNFLRVIDLIESLGPCVILIDEIEKYLGSGAVSGNNDSGTSSRSFGSLLSWLNDRKSEAFIVATSNNYLKLPPELVRAGRFDGWFWVDLPSNSELADIYSVVIRKYGRDPANFDIPALVAASDQFSGAEVENVFTEALFTSFSENKEITSEHVMTQAKALSPQALLEAETVDKSREATRGRLKPASKRETPPISLRETANLRKIAVTN